MRAGKLQRIDRFETVRTQGSRRRTRLDDDVVTIRLHLGEALSEAMITEQHFANRTKVMSTWTMRAARRVASIR